MRRSTFLVAFAAVVLVADGTRAEDPPQGGPAPAAVWSTADVFGHIAASADGSWLAARTRAGITLYPVAGGDPVLLDLGKDEKDGIHLEYQFTADSKWLVVPGTRDYASTAGKKADLTQSVLVFPVATPSKRKSFQLQLKEEKLDKRIRRMAPELSNFKTLEGAVSGLLPLTGSRMVFDRGSAGAEVWDIATGAKSTAPESLDGPYSCGLSADGARSVLAGIRELEVRDVKLNRALKTVACPDYDVKNAHAHHPAFTPDGAGVVVLRGTRAGGASSTDEVAVDCWSIDDAKLRWTYPIGKERVEKLWTAGGYAIAKRPGALDVIDLRDGKPVVHELSGRSVEASGPAADGKSVWVCDGKSLRRMELPPLPVK